MIKNIQLLLTLIFVGGNLAAQNTVGLISYNPTKSFDGYNLVYPHNQPNIYLLNNCGEIVHRWDDAADFRPGNTAYLYPNGNLVKTKRPSAVAGNPIWAGGGGAIVEMRDWDNQLLWSFEMNNDSMRLHHDIAPLDNGNVLMIAWKLRTIDEAIQAGRDTAFAPLTQGKMWEDIIIEINPAGDIVWRWNVWDHLVQDRDATKNNFGVVENSPRLVNINYDSNDGKADWMHSNSLDYNEDLKQIMISVPTFNEFWIIDHTTTTAEAATSSGGDSNLGGDLMYRWGSPANYGGDSADQKSFYQHDVHWIDDYLPTSHPQYGLIAFFNNQVGSDFSTANIIIPPWDMYSWEYTLDSDTWGPNDYLKTFTHPTPQDMYSTGLSSIQLLPNGNTMLCSGRFGYTFELTPDDEIVWEYITPRKGVNPATQGDTLTINNNLTFRMKRIPIDYQAFDGRDLTPQEYLELEPNLDFCPDIINDLEEISQYDLKIYPNPASDILTIEWEKGGKEVGFKVYDVVGRKIEDMTATGGRKFLDISHWENGMYIVIINDMELKRVVVTR